MGTWKFKQKQAGMVLEALNFHCLISQEKK